MTDTNQAAATPEAAAAAATLEQAAAASAAPISTPASEATPGGVAAAKPTKAAKPDAPAEAAAAHKPWYDGLPDDLKAQGHVTRHASVEDAVRALIGAEKRLGVPADQLVRLPTKPEERAELYGKLGAPETAEGYKITVPDGASDADKAAAQSFAEHMHKAGPFPPDFVEAAVAWNNEQAEAASKALADADAASKLAGETFLKDQLKDKYDPEMAAVGKLLNDLGGPELAAEFDAKRAGDNPLLMLAFHKVLERLGEPQTLDGLNSPAGQPRPISPGQAKAARENLENDPIKGKALRDNSHSMHNSVVEERSRLIRIEEGLDPDA